MAGAWVSPITRTGRLLIGLLVIVLVDHCVNSFTPCIKGCIKEVNPLIVAHAPTRANVYHFQLLLLDDGDPVLIRVDDVILQCFRQFPLQKVRLALDFAVQAEVQTELLSDDYWGADVGWGFSMDVYFHANFRLGYVDIRLFERWLIECFHWSQEELSLVSTEVQVPKDGVTSRTLLADVNLAIGFILID